MSDSGRYIAEIPAPRRREGISWLVLEREESSGGWTLLGHRTLGEGSEFDSWHQTRDQAEREAASLWGVTASSWRPDLRAV